MTKSKVEEQVKTEEIRYSKKQLVLSKKYSSNRDVLQALLEENKSYTSDEVEKIIKEFKKRKV